MRIIAGRWRSHRLLAAGRSVRPTTDRTRQILFDIVGRSIVGSRVLDLYAGSGALGLEALSRGAAFAILIDEDARATQGIRRNIAALDAAEVTEVWTRRVGSSLVELLQRGERFDWIFADPPYGKGEDLRLLERLGASHADLLLEGGCLVLEAPRVAPAPAAAGTLVLDRLRDVGGTSLRFYRRKPHNPGIRSGEDADER